ncbi:MAG: MBOAT family O-acyltransferase [Oscillospiraceae bacterium]
MVFSGIEFLYVFLPLCLILYFLTGDKQGKNVVLILFSLIFYAWGEPVWVILLIFSSFVDFFCGKFVGRHHGKPSAKLGVVISLTVNLGLLAVFKYTGFFVENLNAVTGLTLSVPTFSLPIGISFYTFQTISYTVDVYRGEVDVQKSFLKFLMYVSLFPQLVAGPIVRYSVIEDEINNRKTTLSGFSHGLSRFILGLGKKVIIANTVGELVSLTLDKGISSSMGAWAGVLMFSFQIYFDFSGYSDMAIGLGEMFGFHYHENFNYPYVSKSVSEFWRRWHISLGSFFRDYLYIPLGGNRKFPIRNLLIVWFLTGLWHGASWNFVIWGLYFGFFIIIEKLFMGKILDRIPAFFSHLYLLIIVVFGWAVFFFTDLTKLLNCLKAMLFISDIPASDEIVSTELMSKIYVIAAAVIISTGILKRLWRFILKKAEESRRLFGLASAVQTVSLAAILIVSSILLVGGSYNPFLYFRF